MSFKSILKSVAPALGAAFGGPLGGIAGKVIADTFGEEAPKNQNQLEKMVTRAMGDPDLALKLKAADQAFESRMAEIGVDVFAQEVEDKKSAREMAKVNMWPQIILSVVFILGYFVVLTFVFQSLYGDESINPQILVLASTLLGLFTGEIPRIMSFWFGSSAGSKEKTAKLNIAPE